MDDTVNKMKILKIAVLLALAGIGAHAFADDGHSTNATSKAPVEIYTYETKLDIKKVIYLSEIPDECKPVPVQMTYEDSHNQRHVMQYQVMGTGCSNG